MLSKKRIPEFLDGTLKDTLGFAYGPCYGYDTILRVAAGKGGGMYGYTVTARSDDDPGNGKLLAFLYQLRDENKEIKETSVTPNTCYVAIAAVSEKQLLERSNALMPRVYEYLNANGYSSCCSVCGSKDKKTSCYTVNGYAQYMCVECVAGLDASLSEEKVKRTTQKSNLLPGICGALVGSLIGVIVYILIARLGYVSAVGGVVMAVLAVKGYEKLGGCLDTKGVIACVVCVFAGALLGNRLDWSIEAASALKEYGWTFFDCFKEIGYIVDELECRSQYNSGKWLALFFTALGAAGTMITSFKAAKGTYKIAKLD